MPGHCPSDPGYINHSLGLEEYREAVRLSDTICDLLVGGDHATYSPRGSREDRISFVNELKPNVVVELHFNSSENVSNRGVETIHHTSLESRHLAEHIQRKLVQKLYLPHYGIRCYESQDEEHYMIGDMVATAACVVNPLFFSNESDTDFYLTNGIPTKIAELIAFAINSFQ